MNSNKSLSLLRLLWNVASACVNPCLASIHWPAHSHIFSWKCRGSRLRATSSLLLVIGTVSTSLKWHNKSSEEQPRPSQCFLLIDKSELSQSILSKFGFLLTCHRRRKQIWSVEAICCAERSAAKTKWKIFSPRYARRQIFWKCAPVDCKIKPFFFNGV